MSYRDTLFGSGMRKNAWQLPSGWRETYSEGLSSKEKSILHTICLGHSILLYKLSQKRINFPIFVFLLGHLKWKYNRLSTLALANSYIFIYFLPPCFKRWAVLSPQCSEIYIKSQPLSSEILIYNHLFSNIYLIVLLAVSSLSICGRHYWLPANDFDFLLSFCWFCHSSMMKIQSIQIPYFLASHMAEVKGEGKAAESFAKDGPRW